MTPEPKPEEKETVGFILDEIEEEVKEEVATADHGYIYDCC